MTVISVSVNNPNYSSFDGVLFNKNKTELVQYPAGITKTAYTIPSSVKTILSFAFENNKNLTSVTIPNSVETINNSAFSGCESLKSITISNSITEIPDNMFDGCAKLSTVTIPNSVVTIGGSAFSGCIGLTSVTIPNIVTSIGNSAFWNCKALRNITIPNRVENIGNGAFGYCTGLTNITIPSSVKSIGQGAFNYCTALTSISVDSNNTAYSSDNGVLYNKDKTELIQYPSGNTRSTYTIPHGVKSIAGFAFDLCINLTDITIPESVTSIGSNAFYCCKGILNLKIPKSVTEVGYYAFNLVNNIVYDGELDTSSWGGAAINGYVDGNLVYRDSTKTELLGCSSKATSVVIPNSVQSIGINAFYYCENLTSVTIPNSVTTIKQCAFAYCKKLTSIMIPDSVELIDYGVFEGCTGLTNISVDNNNAKFSSLDGVLFDKEKIHLLQYPIGNPSTTYTVPNSVQLIVNYSFSEAVKLVNVTMGNNVTNIGDAAFASCSSLTSLTIPKSVTMLGFGIIHNCNNFTDVYYTGSQEEWLSLDFGHHNENLLEAKIHYNSSGLCKTHKPATAVKENIKNSTCTAGGSYDSVVYCSVCKSEISRTKKDIPKLGHNCKVTKSKKAATCTANGNTEQKTCTRCKAVTGGAVIKATGHKYKTTVTKATTSKNGSIASKCSECGAVKSKTTVYYPKTITLSSNKYTYDGKIKTPTVKVVGSNGKTISSSYYTVSYASGRKNVGNYSVKITFKGNYSGSRTLYFTINPKGTSLSSVSAKSKGFTANWKKQSTQTDGYQIQYSTSSRFTNAKAVSITKNSYTSKSISKLSSSKKYYVRIRTYNKVGSTYYYSSWSSAKSVTTKR